MKKIVIITLLFMLLLKAVAGTSLYTNYNGLIKPIMTDYSQVDSTGFLHQNIQMVPTTIDGIKVWGTGGDFNEDDKYIVYNTPINLETTDWVLVKGVFYIPHSLNDWDVGYGLATTREGSFDRPNGVSFIIEYNSGDTIYHNSFINYYNENYESSACLGSCTSKGWVHIEVIINPYDKAFIMKVNGRQAQYSILDPRWVIGDEYYLSLLGDTDTSSRKVYFDYIKIYQASYSFDEGYKKTQLIYETDFDNSEDLNNNWLPHNNPSHSLTTYDGRSVLAVWGSMNEKNRLFIFNKPLHGITIIEAKLHIGTSSDYDGGVVILGSSDFTWSNVVAQAQVDCEGGDKFYHKNFISIKRNDGNYDRLTASTALIFGWFEARIIYDSQTNLVGISVPVLDFWNTYTTGYFPQNLEIRLLGDTDSSSRKVYLDWLKVYKAENMGTLGDPKYDKGELLFSSDFNDASGLITVGSPSHQLNTVDGVQVLEMWGNYDSSNYLKIDGTFPPQLIIELKGYIGMSQSDYDLQLQIYDKDTGKFYTAFNFDNSISDSEYGYGVGLYLKTPSGATLRNGIYLEPDVSGWVGVETLVNYNEGLCIMRIPKINFELYDYNCGKVLTSPIVYLDLIFDTEDYSRYAYVKSIEVEYLGLKNPIENMFRFGNIESK